MMQGELSALRTADETASRGEYAISDLARMYNVSLRTLRFYEDKGLLEPRRAGTARFYSPRDRIRLELILKGKHLGFTLAEIYELIMSRMKAPLASDEADLTVSLDREQIAAQIVHLERQRDDLATAIDELRVAYRRSPDAVA